MSFLRQQLPALLMPFDISLILVFVGQIIRRRALIWTGFAILWLSSTPLVSQSLVRAIEGWDSERTLAADAPVADAIVVLSTGRVVAPGRAAMSEWNDPDRFFGGVELFQTRKAPLLVFTGAWQTSQPNAPLEGDVLAAYARALGVPPDRIITTGRVSNTADEAHAVAALLRARQATPPRVLLVTSAFHMPRARQLFENTGLTVTIFPVDFWHSSGGGMSVMDFLPSAGALVQTQTAIREMYGRLFYRVMGSTNAGVSVGPRRQCDAMESARECQRQPEHDAHLGPERVDEDRRAAPQAATPRRRAGRLGLHLHRRRVQPGPVAQSGRATRVTQLTSGLESPR